MRRLARRLARPLAGAAGLAATLALWSAVVAGFDIRPFLLPSPADIADAFDRQGGYLFEEAGVTVWHTLTGFGLGATTGLLTAALLATAGWVRDTVLPVLVALQAVPKVAVAPLLIVWLGFGAESKIALVALLCFFPVLVAALAGLGATPAELVELARSLSASRTQTFWKLRVPYAAPQIFTGLKVAGSLALIGAVVAQITTPNAGLGAVIVLAGQSADTPLAFASILLLAVIGVGLYYTLAGLERLLVPWAEATTG